MLKDRTVSMEIKNTCAITWKKKVQKNRIQAVVSYLRGACGMNRIDGESNERVYGRFGMSTKGEGMNCGVVEIVKHTSNSLRWFGHLRENGRR